MVAAVKDLAQFHAERLTGIGGSDAAAICGEDGFKTAYQVALEKLGMLQPDPSLETRINIQIGNRLEDDVAEIYCERNARQVRRVNQLVRSKEHDFMILHPDRDIVGEPGKLEIKTGGVAWEWGKSGTDKIPPRVIIQCQHYMAVYPQDEYVDVAALMFGGGERYRQYRIERDSAFILDLIEVETEFWTKVMIEGVLPEPEWGHSSMPELLKRLYPGLNNQAVQVDNIEHWHACWLESCANRLRYEKLETEIKNHIRAGMKECALAPVADGRWTRRLMKKKAYVVEASEYEELRFIKNRNPGASDGTEQSS